MNLTHHKRIGARRLTWLALLAVGAPLLTLLAVQYRSLRALDQHLPAYRRLLLLDFLKEATSEVRTYYLEAAERVLSVPPAVFDNRQGGGIEDDRERTRSPAAAARAAEHFGRTQFRGASRVFLCVATRSGRGPDSEVFFYNPAAGRMDRDPLSGQLGGIRQACGHLLSNVRAQPPGWATPIIQFTDVNSKDDRANTFLLKLLVDEGGRAVAVGGMVIDKERLVTEIMPELAGGALKRFFPEEHRGADITLSEGRGWVSLLTRQPVSAPPEISMSFPGFLAGYEAGISMPSLGAERAARRHQFTNLILSLAMAAALVASLLLALRSAAREMKLSQMKTDFVANVSHEFRTPLASIRVLAEMMKYERVRSWEKVRAYGEYIDGQGRRLSQLVANILDFSRVESGQREYHFAPADLREVAAEAVEAVAGGLKQGGRVVRLEADPAMPRLEVDRDALTLALTNLLDNAIKYSEPETEIILRLGLEGDALRIAVVDRGIGIPREEQGKIFEKFYRVGTGMVHNVKGSGLGLAIVKHIVEAHRGGVAVESEPGRGSVFTVRLPLGARAADEKEA